ncbi:hypothetical protein BDR26DRAFT_416957 [Obelidium mucronatum]|nr:hypothetical protein BDR26DRAFT_416957 [Obelidium mucronatum]
MSGVFMLALRPALPANSTSVNTTSSASLNNTISCFQSDSLWARLEYTFNCEDRSQCVKSKCFSEIGLELRYPSSANDALAQFQALSSDTSFLQGRYYTDKDCKVPANVLAYIPPSKCFSDGPSALDRGQIKWSMVDSVAKITSYPQNDSSCTGPNSTTRVVPLGSCVELGDSVAKLYVNWAVVPAASLLSPPPDYFRYSVQVSDWEHPEFVRIVAIFVGVGLVFLLTGLGLCYLYRKKKSEPVAESSKD